MVQSSHIHKLSFAIIFIMMVQVAIASFTFSGITDERNKSNKFSLKNLSKYSHNTLSIYSLKSELQLKGAIFFGPKPSQDATEVNSIMQYDRGNTTYILPFKFKIKLPKDKLRIPIR